MSIFLSLLYFLIFGFIIFRFRFFNIEGVSRKTLISLFFIKILCGFFLIGIYKYYYNIDGFSDAYSFYSDSVKIFKSIYNNPVDYLRMVTGISSDAPHLNEYYSSTELWNKLFNYNLYNDNRILIRINAVICLFSFGHFFVHTIFMSFFSFIGLTALFKSFYPFLKNKKKELIIVIFLIPSVLIWTSGIVKESVVIFSLGLIIYSAFELIIKKISVKYIFVFCFTSFILLLSKFYFFIALLPSLIAFLWIDKTNKKYSFIKFITVHICFALIIFSIKFVIPKYSILDIISYKQHAFTNMVKYNENVGSFVQIPHLQPTFISFFKNSIGAFSNTLFRPHLFEVKSLVMCFSAIENMLIILIIGFCIFYSNLKKISSTPLLYLTIFFVIIIFTLSGLVTPVLGSLVRYRTPALPFLLITFLLIYDKEKFKRSGLYKLLLSVNKLKKSDTNCTN